MRLHPWLVPFALLLGVTMTPGAFGQGGASAYLNMREDWYRGKEGIRVAETVLSYQSPLGSWPKNVDTATNPYSGDPSKLRGTFDNGATTDELRFLARAARATGEPRYQKAFLKGLDHILAAQYATGGWPQSYPPGGGYHRHITFNDGTMVRLMEFLREVAANGTYDFVDEGRRAAARKGFDRGIECILRCQVRVNGKLTAWCSQHDEKDYRPRPGRAYELVSLSGSETVGIVRLLMSLEDPSPEVIRAVEGAVSWLEAVKLNGSRVVRREDPRSPSGFNRVLIRDDKAPPLWARFYEIGTNRPLFSDRDGAAKYRLSEIGYERRNGYAWLGDWPARLLAEEYPAWRRRR